MRKTKASWEGSKLAGKQQSAHDDGARTLLRAAAVRLSTDSPTESVHGFSGDDARNLKSSRVRLWIFLRWSRIAEEQQSPCKDFLVMEHDCRVRSWIYRDVPAMAHDV